MTKHPQTSPGLPSPTEATTQPLLMGVSNISGLTDTRASVVSARKSDMIEPSDHHRYLWKISGVSTTLDPDGLCQVLRKHPDIQTSNTVGTSGRDNEDECEDIVVRTLAVDPNRPAQCQATVSFRHLSPKLTENRATGRTFEIRVRLPTQGEIEQAGAGLQKMAIGDNFDGLTALYSPPPNKHEADIIAVPGLAGHPFGSFVHKSDGYMWLADGLPQDLSTARVMIYGHQSRLKDSVSFATLDDLANSLQRTLSRVLKNGRSRVVLIGHSLGGLLIKLALIRMNQSESERALVGRIAATVFFGVPHEGMDIESLTPITGNGPNRALLESLNRINPKELASRNQDFTSMLREHSFKVYCFFETSMSHTAVADEHGNYKMMGERKCFVTPISATSCLPLHQRDGSIAMQRTHSDLVKFSRYDEDYHIVLDVLKQCIPDTVIANRPRGVVRHSDTAIVRENDTSASGADRGSDPQDTLHAESMSRSSSGFATIQTDGCDKTGPPPRLYEPNHYIPIMQNPHFVGRQQYLSLLNECLVCSPSSSQRAFALWGPRGQGKTQTARQFVKESERFFKHILWVGAGDETSLIASYAGYARRFEVVGTSIAPAIAAGRLKQWFTEQSAYYKSNNLPHSSAADIMEDSLCGFADELFLVVFDSAEESKLISEWWPCSDHGSILITTVDPIFQTSNYAGRGEKLSPLSEDDASKMVLDQVRKEALSKSTEMNLEAARQVVSRVECLPLAISGIIGTINSDATDTLSGYNERNKHAEPILTYTAEVFDRRFAPYGKAIADVFREQLRVLGRDAASLAMMEVISLLHGHRIPGELLGFGKGPGGIADIDFTMDFGKHIKSLSRGLLDQNERMYAEEPLHYGVHGLIRQFVRQQMTDKSRQKAFDSATQLLYVAIDPLASYTEKEPSRETDRRLFLDYFTHIQSVKGFGDQLWKERGNVLRVPVYYFMLLAYSSWICYSVGSFADGLELLNSAGDILRSINASTRAWSEKPGQIDMIMSKLEMTHNYACIASEIGDFSLSLEKFQEEESIYTEAMDTIWKDSAEDHSERLANILGGIANSYQGLNDHTRAEEYYARCLELGERDDIHCPFEVNICRSQWARGALDVASTRLEKLIQLREREYGQKDDKDFIIGHMKYVLGNVRLDQQRFDEAFELHTDALDCWRKTQPYHHKTGDACHKVGWHHTRRKEWNQAEASLRSGLEVYRSGTTAKFFQCEIARSSYKLSLVLQELGKYEESERMQMEATAMKARLSKNTHVDKTCQTEAAYDALVSLWAR
ncbi:uncharacterized protein E0L32_011592 [Thyridium curvatum]|uniref:Uncharacterized protein n=1 Tax=Thyridium curvatum TaxID=1093900 RepID=A0A507BLV2_9PEZI|nr:uncharacterized protein E0L32_011592 [Thyridium curvatum]TPX18479.1 hypothetical protein E0L32_011592 [Thyridium curvatum]